MRTLAVAALALAALAAMLGSADARPRCFGAASRDPAHRCVNPRLRKMVAPTPDQAQLRPPARCSPFEAPISACRFGTSSEDARATMALVGDSHAEHWRASLWPVTKALRWSGISITHASCPLSRAVPVASKWKREDCAAYNRDVTQWLADHPEIHTVVTSNHPGHVVRARGKSERATKVAGIIKAWKALPRTVRHIIVIRDVPFMRQRSLDCVRRAHRKHRDAGSVCAFSRRKLHRDYYVEAARKLHSRRVQVVDMTHFFCGKLRCFPVVGGALVYKDAYDHVTTVYGKTLGPYLLAKIRRLKSSWY
jgi:hypothetical protein